MTWPEAASLVVKGLQLLASWQRKVAGHLLIQAGTGLLELALLTSFAFPGHCSAPGSRSEGFDLG